MPSAKPTILLNDFQRQWTDTGTTVMSAIETVGQSGWYVLGRQVETFERALAPVFGRRHAIGCSNGLDAIEIALRALGLRPGDRVLTTPLSAFATTLAIVRAGGVPVFVDVDHRGLIDLDACERLLASDPDRTTAPIRFFVPVHLYGHPVDLVRLATLRDRFNLLMVEDCAQSVAASWDGVPAGSIGQMAATSFYPTKNLGALGDGGAILTDDAHLQALASSLRHYGQSARYVHEHLGLNARLDELHAAVLNAAFLPRLPAWTDRRRAVARRYLAGIKHAKVRLLPAAEKASSCWHLFPILVPAADRTGFQAHLDAHGIQTAIHYPRLISDQQALRDVRYEVHGDLAQAQRLAIEEVSLPIHPYLQDAEVDTVVDVINRWPTA